MAYNSSSEQAKVEVACDCLRQVENLIVALCRQLMVAGEEEEAKRWYTAVRKVIGDGGQTLAESLYQAREAAADERKGCWSRTRCIADNMRRNLESFRELYATKHGSSQRARAKQAPRTSPEQVPLVEVLCSLPIIMCQAFAQAIGSLTRSSGGRRRKHSQDPYAEIRSERRPCVRCGYDLRVQVVEESLPARCPDCGLPFERQPVVLDSSFELALSALQRLVAATAELSGSGT